MIGPLSYMYVSTMLNFRSEAPSCRLALTVGTSTLYLKVALQL